MRLPNHRPGSASKRRPSDKRRDEAELLPHTLTTSPGSAIRKSTLQCWPAQVPSSVGSGKVFGHPHPDERKGQACQFDGGQSPIAIEEKRPYLVLDSCR